MLEVQSFETLYSSMFQKICKKIFHLLFSCHESLKLKGCLFLAWAIHIAGQNVNKIVHKYFCIR